MRQVMASMDTPKGGQKSFKLCTPALLFCCTSGGGAAVEFLSGMVARRCSGFANAISGILEQAKSDRCLASLLQERQGSQQRLRRCCRQYRGSAGPDGNFRRDWRNIGGAAVPRRR